jgi:hypothetical protein
MQHGMSDRGVPLQQGAKSASLAAGVYFERGKAILLKREEIERDTINADTCNNPAGPRTIFQPA